MIRSLAPLLSTPQHNPRLIERLDFRTDLQRGDKGVIYAELSKLLRSGPCVLRRGVRKNDLFRWLADKRHSNLGVSFEALQRAVNKAVEVDY